MINTLQPTTIMINVATDFSDVPGPRSRDEGTFSGEQFLEDLLLPQFKLAVAGNQKLCINLDGTEGYATSFLESAFGGLTRLYNPDFVLSILEFVSDEEPYLVEEITIYISEAAGK